MAAAENDHPSPNTADERRVLHVTLAPETKEQAKQKGFKPAQATVVSSIAQHKHTSVHAHMSGGAWIDYTDRLYRSY